MKYMDINKRYTEIVTEWIGKGYTINTATMSGSQGEKARVDLTNGTEVIRVLIGSYNDYKEHTEGIEIIVGKCIDNVKPHNAENYHTIWNDHLEVLHCERFGLVGDSRRGYFYGTEAEAKTAKRKRYERWRRNNAGCVEKVNFENGKAVTLAKKYILRKNICKRISTHDISVYKKIDNGKAQYAIAYKSAEYDLS